MKELMHNRGCEKNRTQRVHVPNNYALGFWVIVIIVLVLGKYIILRYLER